MEQERDRSVSEEMEGGRLYTKNDAKDKLKQERKTAQEEDGREKHYIVNARQEGKMRGVKEGR